MPPRKTEEKYNRVERGTLYVVATPLGNLEDITIRAIRILEGVDLVACEDTRLTARLLRKYEIETPMISYHAHNERSCARRVIAALGKEQSVALVTDAGTPAVSDPGMYLVREVLRAGFMAVPIPGPSAATAAVSASGLPSQRFTVLGFPPGKSGAREKLFRSLRDTTGTLVFYESPRKIRTTLREVRAVLGDREAVLFREMTKLHEEIRRGKISEILGWMGETPVRGEVTLLIAEGPSPEEGGGLRPLDEARALVTDGMSAREAARVVASRRGAVRRDLYRELVKKHGRERQE
jgi:16S rRNA (cytidine1402-2'-O)-methyltransferase